MKKTKQFRPTAFIQSVMSKLSLMLLLMTMLVPQGAWALGGSGTSSDPFTIANENDLFDFADRVNNRSYGNSCFKLVANITLTKAWTPIGTSSNPYTATFDGNNKTISGLNLTAKAANAGFFGYVNGATIKNFSLAGSISSGYENTGSVVGSADGATKIYNVYSSVNITMTAAKNHIGGIAGQLLQENSKVSEIKGCAYSGTMNLGSCSDSNGGIVGYCEKNANIEIEYCLFSGSMSTSVNSPNALGGILGYADDDGDSQNFQSLKYCFVSGTLSPNSGTNVGAIAGQPKGKVANTGIIANNNYVSGVAANALGNSKTSATSTPITISVTAGTTGGSVSKSYVNPTTSTATQLQVVATPDEHYHFGSWSDSGAQTHNVGLTDNVNLTASFAIDRVQILVTSLYGAPGTTQGTGTYDYGSKITIKAIPDEHAHFVEWGDGDTHATRTITVTKECTTYHAYFAIDQHTITVKANNDEAGTVSGGGTFDYNSTKTISATPKTGYHFEQWNDGNTDASRTITVTENKTYTATFAPNQYTITVRADNGNYGTVIGGGTYDYGTQLTITATAKTGYHFDHWYGGNTDASRTITVTENKTYTAIFALNQYTITVKANNDNYGRVTGGGTYNYQSIIQIRATPKEHYYFVEWNDGDRNIWRNITVTEDKTYTATFAPNQYTITVKTNNDNYGTVNGGGTFDYGLAETITATPKTGCHFVKWSDDNTNASRTITVNGHATYTAVFAKHTYGEWITDVEATCTTDGTKHRVCTHDGCNADDVVTIPACHQWGDDHTCTVCGHAAEIAHTGTSGTCTWAIYEDGLMIVEPTEGETGTLEKWGDWVSAVPWNNYKDDIISVQFRGKVIAQRCEYMFYRCKNLRTIDFENFDTKNETSMYAMFSDCISLQSLDLSSFNTASVTDMSSMFNSCSSLQSLDLSSFNTASVTNMSSMFDFCPSLQSLDLSNFNTSSVADMSYMFSDCSSLQSLDLSNFNTSSVTDMSSMFYDCCSLATLKLSNDFVLNEEVDKDNLFGYCGTEADELSIYYVIDESIKETLLYETNLFELYAWGKVNFVPSAIVKDGVPFVTAGWAWDIPAENIVFTRQFTAEKPASAMLPFTVAASQISGATFYEFKGVKYENDEWVADMTEVTTVREYTPYVVITSGTGITFTGDNIMFQSTEFVNGNMTQTDAETGWTFVALNEFKRWEAGDVEIGKAYGFAGKDKTVDGKNVHQGEFVKLAAGANAKPGRCYLVKEGDLVSNAKGMKAAAADELPSTIKVRFINGETTGIAELNTETGEMSEVQWYDLNGRKIDEPTKGGIYIKNNKKVFVK